MGPINGISKFLLSLAEDFVAEITNGNVTSIVLNIIFLVGFIFWIYFGIKIFLDAIHRYKTNIALRALFLIYGLLTGPFGWFIYKVARPKYTQEEVDFLKTEHKFYFQQAAKVLECSNCGVYLLEHQIFCTNCGTQNRFYCQNCNALNNADVKFCYSCGYKFNASAMTNLSDHEETFGKIAHVSDLSQKDTASHGSQKFLFDGFLKGILALSKDKSIQISGLSEQVRKGISVYLSKLHNTNENQVQTAQELSVVSEEAAVYTPVTKVIKTTKKIRRIKKNRKKGKSSKK